MPLNFPEVWKNRVENKLVATDQAPWLAGIEELDTSIIEMGSGTAGEKNIIRVPTSQFMPNVLVNNTTYPIALQQYTDDETLINLDKFQTEVTTLSDDEIIGASYRRIDNATAMHVTAILSYKYQKAIHALAPDADADYTAVVFTSGANDVTGTRKKITFDDIVALKGRFDAMQVPPVGRRLVLSADHWNDLLSDESKKYFNTLLVDFRAGMPVPSIAGFEIFSYIANPFFDADGNKLPWGAAADETDMRASVAFYVPNIAMKTGLTKQYFSPATLDPQNQTNQLNYRHYFIVAPKQKMYYGAIASAAA